MRSMTNQTKQATVFVDNIYNKMSLYACYYFDMVWTYVHLDNLSVDNWETIYLYIRHNEGTL